MFVWVYSGLTSRCHTIAEAYCLAKKYEKNPKLTIVWTNEPGCGISYHDVFSKKQFSDIRLKVVELHPLNYSIRKLLTARCGIRNLTKVVTEIITRFKIKFWNAHMQKKQYFIDYEPPKEVGWSGEAYKQWNLNCHNRLKRMLEDGKKVYVHAYNRISNDKKIISSVKGIVFKEVFEISSNNILSGYKNIIGVHIRRTDHAVAIKNSTIESFNFTMKGILEKDSSAMFFLATDDPVVEKEMKEKFDGHIIVQPDKKWGRDAVEEMRSGLIDCLCLSKCDYILGSYTSVFSTFVAEFGGKNLYICKGNGVEDTR